MSGKKAGFQPLSEETWAHPSGILLAKHIKKCYINFTQPHKEIAVGFKDAPYICNRYCKESKQVQSLGTGELCVQAKHCYLLAKMFRMLTTYCFNTTC